VKVINKVPIDGRRSQRH